MNYEQQKKRNDNILANLDYYPDKTVVVHPQIGITTVGNLKAYRDYAISVRERMKTEH